MAISERDIARVVGAVVKLAPLGDAQLGEFAISDATGRLDGDFMPALRGAVARGALEAVPVESVNSVGTVFRWEEYRITPEGYRFLAEHGPRRKETIPDELRWAIWERDDFRCRSCGARRFLSIDHIVAESKGGRLEASNLQTLCVSCNSRKGAR